MKQSEVRVYLSNAHNDAIRWRLRAEDFSKVDPRAAQAARAAVDAIESFAAYLTSKLER